MSREIDEIMSEDPLKLSEQDLDAIIAYQRKMQAQAAMGVKTKKESGPKVDLGSILDKIIKPKPVVSNVKRRV